MKNVVFTILIFSILYGCSTVDNKPEIKYEAENKSIPEFNLNNCLEEALTKDSIVNMQTYDSLDTRYMHEILDYTDQMAMELAKDLELQKKILLSDSISNNAELTDLKQYEITQLEQELAKFGKEVVGYVFVHTFLSNSDTLSRIIVMDNECKISKAIPIRAIKDINPNDYLRKIRKIE